MAPKINIDTTQDPPQINIDTGDSTPELPDQEVQNRAFKFQKGLSDVIDSTSVIDRLKNAEERHIRYEASTAKNLQNETIRNQRIVNLAIQKQGPLDSNDLAILDWQPDKGVKPWPTHPETVMEEGYADWTLQQMKKNVERNDLGYPWSLIGTGLNPYFQKAQGVTKDILAQQEYINTQYQNANAEYSKSGFIDWMNWAGDEAKDLLTLGLRTEFMLRGNVDDVSFFKGFLGTNLREQADKLLSLPLDQLKDTLPSILERLDPSQKVTFLSYLKGKSVSDERLDNIISAVNIGGVVTGGGKFAVQTFKRAADAIAIDQALKKLAKDGAKTEVATQAAVTESVGDIGKAAEEKVTAKVANSVENKVNPVQESVDALTDSFKSDTDKMVANKGSMATEATNRLEEESRSFMGKLVDTLTKTLKVDRVQALLATEENLAKIRQIAKDNYRGPGSVLNVTGPEFNPIANTHDWVYHVGDPAAELFANKEQAEAFAKTLQYTKYNIEPEGMLYKITFRRPLDEDGYLLRDGLILTKDQTTPASMFELFSSYLGYIRTPEETLALEQNWNRKVAAYAPSNFLKLVKETAAPIRALARGDIKIDPLTGEKIPIGTYVGGTKKRYREWRQVVDYAKQMKDEQGRPGAFFESIGDLEAEYVKRFHRIPTFEETEAYFAYKRLVELDRTFRNIQLYKLKHRVGAEQHQFSLLQDMRANNMPAGQSRIGSGWFDATSLNALPQGTSRDNLLVLGDKLGQEQIHNFHTMPGDVRNQISKAVEKNEGKLLELWDANLRPFMGLGKVDDDRITHVFIKNGTLETKPLDFNQVPRRGGGHFDYDYEHYIKQPNMRRDKHSGNWWYEGDTTIMPISGRAMGEDIAGKLDQIRVLLQSNKVDEAKNLAQSTLPMSWKEIHSWFKPSFDPTTGQKTPPRLNLSEKIQVVQKNTKISAINSDLQNKYKDAFMDGTQSGSPAARYPVQYTAERDNFEMFTLANKGSKGNPLYQIEPAQFVDAITSMNRGLSKIINTSFMDDYKISAVEHWLREAAKYSNRKMEDLASSPFWHFQNFQYAKNMAPETKALLEGNRMKIQQFIGVPSGLDNFFFRWAQNMADYIYEKRGPQAIDPSWVLHKLKDGPRFARSIAFHMGLGIFSPAQLLVQANNYVSILGIAGSKYAIPGAYAAMLHGLTAVNKHPEILNHLDALASKIRIPGMSAWRPGEWKEALDEYSRTGMRHVGGEYAALDNPLTVKLLQNQFESFLDAGTMFFKAGEKGSRAASYYTAFKEFRDKNPFGRLTDKDRQSILARADMLNGNMTRASNSMLNHGVLSIPTQFYTYVLRQAELFMGKRLTIQEKTRLAATHFAMYGAPLAMGLTGLPIGDMFQKAAIEHGYQVGNNFIDDLTMNGLPTMLIALATGKGDFAKGNYYNIGDRYGVPGYQPLLNVLKSDYGILKMIGGASGQKLYNSFAALEPFYTWANDLATGQGDFKLTPEDFAKPFQQISSLNTARRYSAALNTGRWISSNGMSLTQGDKVSPMNALFMSLTGLQPTEAAGVYPKSQVKSSEADQQKQALKEFVAEFRQGFYNLEGKTKDQLNQYFKNAVIKLRQSGYPEEKISQAIAIASRGYEDTISRVDQSFFTKDVPESLKKERMRAYELMLRNQGIGR